jgi:exopolysaccharide biosynthesis polyprenyl glycosylphosphotransferase
VEVAGFLPLPGAEGVVPPDRVLPQGGKLMDVAKRVHADWIVLAVEDPRARVPAEDLAAARLAGISCFTPAMLTERLLRRIPVEGLRASEIAFAEGFAQSRGHRFVKRVIDLFAASVGLLLAAPLLLLAACAIKLDSRGPLFYGQPRIGRHGRPFQVVKLRTMRVDAEAGGAPQWATADDPRVTRVGRLLRKTRIDEIPQLFAVLRGDMSLVGPRPERPFFVEQLKQMVPWYAAREAVPPGVTGWAQLRYPYGASVEESKAKLEYDLYYIKNGSAFLDIAILFHTVRHVLTGRGAR